jgi:hypothetical protein
LSEDRRVSWVRIVLEGGVIVVSILLAFALDAWWDDTQERARVGEMLDAVATEFEAERTAMDSVAAENERVIAWYEQSLRRTDPDLPPLSEDSIRVLGSEIQDYQIWEAGFGALAALLDGSLLEKVPDPELRRLLGGWDGELGDLRWTERQVYDAQQRMADLVVTRGWAPQRLDDTSWYVTRLRGMTADREFRAAEMLWADARWAYNEDLYRVRARASEIAGLIRRGPGSGR